MKAIVTITLKNGVLDPQGAAIEGALGHLGFGGVARAQVGKIITLELAETDRDAARAAVMQMCEKLLANTVIEKYTVEIQ